jgi:AcrR family transcriptional regulator
MRLRELNKRRTREAIVRVSVGLFLEQGYRETTLAAIAGAAGVAPSTLHAYFPVKEDLVFDILDVVVESAKTRLVDRPETETTLAAIPAWVADDLPVVSTRYGADYLVHIYDVMKSDPDLWTQRRFRLTLLQEVFAASFAKDFDASAGPLPAKVLAGIAVHAIEEVFDVWHDWYKAEAGATENDLALAELTALTTEHVRELLEASTKLISLLPDSAACEIEYPAPKRARIAARS